MSDLPPDLARLRVIETYLRLQLEQVRAAIQAAEQQAEKRAAPPAPPAGEGIRWWRLERAPKPGEYHALLHRGDCPGGQGRVGITREEAVVALQDVHADGTRTAAPCPRCRPDLGLGVDKP